MLFFFNWRVGAASTPPPPHPESATVCATCFCLGLAVRASLTALKSRTTEPLLKLHCEWQQIIQYCHSHYWNHKMWQFKHRNFWLFSSVAEPDPLLRGIWDFILFFYSKHGIKSRKRIRKKGIHSLIGLSLRKSYLNDLRVDKYYGTLFPDSPWQYSRIQGPQYSTQNTAQADLHPIENTLWKKIVRKKLNFFAWLRWKNTQHKKLAKQFIYYFKKLNHHEIGKYFQKQCC